MTKYIPQTPTPKQAAFLLLSQREALFGGSASGGKSSCLLMCALQYVDVPGYSALILRKTFADLSLPGAIMDRAKEWLSPFTNTGEVQWKDKEKRFIFPSGASLTFGYLDTSTDKHRYAGAEFTLCCFDELTQFNEDDYTFLFSRLRKPRDLPVPVRMRAATNPGNIGHHWVKSRFFDIKDKSRRIFIPARIYDNPHVDQADYIESLNELNAVDRARLLDGDWEVKNTGLVYPELSDCVVDPWKELPEGFHVGGIDWGFTNPAVFLAGVIDKHGVLWLDFERYMRGKTLPEHMEALPKEREILWFADPAEPESIAQMRRGDFVVRKANNSIAAGIKIVKDWIKRGKLKISRDCKALIEEAGLYRYPTDQEQDETSVVGSAIKATELPIKRFEHCLPAGTMILTDTGNRPIESIVPGDTVWTPSGLRKVTDAGKTGDDAEIWEVETSDGRLFRGTRHHLVFTVNRGWRPIGLLESGDELSAVSIAKQFKRHAWDRRPGFAAKRLSSREIPTEDILTLREGNSRSTTHDLVVEDDCTRTSMNRPTDLFLMDSTSITSTRILSIIRSTISSAFRRRITSSFTWMKRGLTKRGNISIPSATSHPSGTEPMRGGRGTPITPRKSGQNENQRSLLVSIATRNTNREIEKKPRDFAQTHAGLTLGRNPASITSIETASSAKKYSGSTDTPGQSAARVYVARSSEGGRSGPVFDLTLEDGGFDECVFYAHGILVHNSLDCIRYLLCGIHKMHGGQMVDQPDVPDSEPKRRERWSPKDGPYEREPEVQEKRSMWDDENFDR